MSRTSRKPISEQEEKSQVINKFMDNSFMFQELGTKHTAHYQEEEIEHYT